MKHIKMFENFGSKTEDDLYEQIDLANDCINSGESKYPGMSYEEGVKSAIEWILGLIPEAPMKD